MAIKVRNVQQGFVGPNGVFHPIRSSADYDPSRVPVEKKRIVKAKRKAAAQKAAKTRAANKRAAARVTRAKGKGQMGRSRRNPQAEIRELVIFIDNDGNLYRQMTQPIHKNLINKKAAGKYSSTLALKAFENLATEGAKRYAKEVGGHLAGWNQMFTVADRKEAAKELRDSFEEEAALGNYDNYLHKKYQGKKANPIPVGRFVNAKVRMLKGGLTQVLLEGKAVGRRIVKAAKGKRNPNSEVEKLARAVGADPDDSDFQFGAYVYAMDHHEGQFSPLYEVLSSIRANLRDNHIKAIQSAKYDKAGEWDQARYYYQQLKKKKAGQTRTKKR